MKTGAKVGLLVGCGALLVTASVMGTLAYLTSEDTVTNTFTIGDVAILLDEALVNEYGETVDAEGNAVSLANASRVEGNEYKLIPSHTYVKDPTVTVLADSEKSYIRLLVTITDARDLVNTLNADSSESYSRDLAEEQFAIFFTNYDSYSTNWTLFKATNDTTNNTVTYEYRYNFTIDTLDGEDLELELLFDGFTVPYAWDSAELETVQDFAMDITAQAIQADGFTTATKAWEAFDAQFAEPDANGNNEVD